MVMMEAMVVMAAMAVMAVMVMMKRKQMQKIQPNLYNEVRRKKQISFIKKSSKYKTKNKMQLYKQWHGKIDNEK